MQTVKTTSYLSLFDVNGTMHTEIMYVSSFDLNSMVKIYINTGEVMSQLIHRTSASKKTKGLFIYDEASKSRVGPGEFNL